MACLSLFFLVFLFVCFKMKVMVGVNVFKDINDFVRCDIGDSSLCSIILFLFILFWIVTLLAFLFSLCTERQRKMKHAPRSLATPSPPFPLMHPPPSPSRSLHRSLFVYVCVCVCAFVIRANRGG